LGGDLRTYSRRACAIGGEIHTGDSIDASWEANRKGASKIEFVTNIGQVGDGGGELNSGDASVGAGEIPIGPGESEGVVGGFVSADLSAN
jgi:hypothetical protein